SQAPDQEPVGDVSVRPGGLTATIVGGEEVPRLIDEIPLVAALGARAKGTTKISDAIELRAKESDRIDAVVKNLRGLGVEVTEYQDGLEVQGTDDPLRGQVRAFHDHRIAMSFSVLNTVRSCDIEVDDRAVAGVSFPGFWGLMAEVERARRRSE
ncbi:MAG: 3-phosphoshikimate 1-carboxyvinyltransferase, partial [Gemmatimonadetes bacterium]|nr:3-phosphoshikimate 1-carboxyvinyltransferase [Gemmatimonadota bacterium]